MEGRTIPYILEVDGYVHHTGHHCETTAFRNVLAHAGMDLSEEMLFGLGEGLGFIYWFMKGKKVAMPYPFVGYRGGKVVEVIAKGAARLGVGCKAVETGSAQRAYDNVARLLASATPVCVYVDMAGLPYMHLPEEAHFGGHAIALYRIDEADGTARVSDCLDEPQTITLDDLARARASTHQPFPPKNRHLELKLPTHRPALEDAVSDAIGANARAMAEPPISNFGLKGLLRFAAEVKKWPAMLSPDSLLWALVYAFVYIETGGTGGRGFRPMYARFLREAHALTGGPNLLEAAELYERCGEALSALGVALLPDRFAGMAEIRRLMFQKDSALKHGTGPGRESQLAEVDQRMQEAVQRALANDVPNYADNLGALVEAIRAAHAAEVRANAVLVR